MLEAYGDEWLVIPAMHYRWFYDRDWAMAEFGAMNAPDESAENQLAIGQKLAVPFSKAATLLGATEDMVPAVETAYENLLAELASNPNIEVIGDPVEIEFDGFGALVSEARQPASDGRGR